MLVRRPREPRRLTCLKAQLHDGRRQSDVLIGNVSTGGLMAKCAAPPPKGARVEIRHGGLCITGRVAWSRYRRFGLHSDEAIDVAALLPPQPARISFNARRFGQQLPPLAARVQEPGPRRRAASAGEAGVREALVVGLVATVTTCAVELGFLNFWDAWDVLRHFLSGAPG